MDVVIILASVNRADEIMQLLRLMKTQSVMPKEVILSVVGPGDIPAELAHLGHGDVEASAIGFKIRVLIGSKGLTVQRNRGLEVALPISDVVVFFDDDFLPANDAIEGIVKLFRENQQIVGATGQVLKDGVNFGGLTYDEAIAILDNYNANQSQAPVPNLAIDEAYGCNMAFRSAAIGNIRFDEKLPLYAWQEDVDFAGQLLAKGLMVKTAAFAGVHRGVTKGRSPGLALGFSQMVNPIYLVKKGTMRPSKAAELILKNLLANHLKALWPESYVDRAGRMRGNWRGLFHLICGKSDPAEILRLR